MTTEEHEEIARVIPRAAPAPVRASLAAHITTLKLSGAGEVIDSAAVNQLHQLRTLFLRRVKLVSLDNASIKNLFVHYSEVHISGKLELDRLEVVDSRISPHIPAAEELVCADMGSIGHVSARNILLDRCSGDISSNRAVKLELVSSCMTSIFMPSLREFAQAHIDPPPARYSAMDGLPTNLETIRSPFTAAAPYLARFINITTLELTADAAVINIPRLPRLRRLVLRRRDPGMSLAVFEDPQPPIVELELVSISVHILDAPMLILLKMTQSTILHYVDRGRTKIILDSSLIRNHILRPDRVNTHENIQIGRGYPQAARQDAKVH